MRFLPHIKHNGTKPGGYVDKSTFASGFKHLWHLAMGLPTSIDGSMVSCMLIIKLLKFRAIGFAGGSVDVERIFHQHHRFTAMAALNLRLAVKPWYPQRLVHCLHS